MGMQLAAVDLRGSWKAASVGHGPSPRRRGRPLVRPGPGTRPDGVDPADDDPRERHAQRHPRRRPGPGIRRGPGSITKIIFLTTLAGLFTLTLLLTLV
ncbi:MAG: hypothetical protein MZV64_33700 [Ignavibacteriales bacterium]|nr:hypothetical protein [Ignavibacteriales bacterium]